MKDPFRHPAQPETVPSTPMSQPTPAEIGATILSRYNLESWQDGRSTGRAHLFGRKILKVEEIRLGGMAFVGEEEALRNGRAIRAWAQSVGIPAYQIALDQRYDYAPYVAVPESAFEEVVLPHLQALMQQREEQ